MSTLELSIGIVFILIGVMVGVFAEPLFSIFDFESRRAQYIRVASAILGGVGLILAASASDSPDLLRFLGTMALTGGVALSLIPTRLWVRMVRWWTKEHLTFYRVVTVTVLTLLGGFIAYTAFPKPRLLRTFPNPRIQDRAVT